MHIFTCQSKKLGSSIKCIENLVVEEYCNLINIAVIFWPIHCNHRKRCRWLGNIADTGQGVSIRSKKFHSFPTSQNSGHRLLCGICKKINLIVIHFQYGSRNCCSLHFLWHWELEIGDCLVTGLKKMIPFLQSSCRVGELLFYVCNKH